MEIVVGLFVLAGFIGLLWRFARDNAKREADALRTLRRFVDEKREISSKEQRRWG